MKYFVILSISTFAFLLATPLLSAQAPCTPIFGGGMQEDKTPYCVENEQTAQATPQPTEPTQSGFTTPNSGLTKGGLAVQPAPSVSKQPTTGPEMFSLLALIPAGLLGWKLRKQTTH